MSRRFRALVLIICLFHVVAVLLTDGPLGALVHHKVLVWAVLIRADRVFTSLRLSLCLISKIR